MAGFLDHGFVGSSVNDEHQCIVVFDGLDGALSAEGILDDGVLVPGLFLLDALSLILGFTSKGQGLGSSESGLGPHLVLSDGVSAFLH